VAVASFGCRQKISLCPRSDRGQVCRGPGGDGSATPPSRKTGASGEGAVPNRAQRAGDPRATRLSRPLRLLLRFRQWGKFRRERRHAVSDTAMTMDDAPNHVDEEAHRSTARAAVAGTPGASPPRRGDVAAMGGALWPKREDEARDRLAWRIGAGDGGRAAVTPSMRVR
jgi:hypothetical protein